MPKIDKEFEKEMKIEFFKALHDEKINRRGTIIVCNE